MEILWDLYIFLHCYCRLFLGLLFSRYLSVVVTRENFVVSTAEGLFKDSYYDFGFIKFRWVRKSKPFFLLLQRRQRSEGLSILTYDWGRDILGDLMRIWIILFWSLMKILTLLSGFLLLTLRGFFFTLNFMCQYFDNYCYYYWLVF